MTKTKIFILINLVGVMLNAQTGAPVPPVSVSSPPAAEVQPQPTAAPPPPPPPDQEVQAPAPPPPSNDWAGHPLINKRSFRIYDETIPWPDITVTTDHFNRIDLRAPSKVRLKQIIEASYDHCQDILKQYEKHFKATEKVTNIGKSFSTNCDQIKVDVANASAQFEGSDFVRRYMQAAHPMLMRRFDITYFNHLVAFSYNTVAQAELLERSYKASIFGKIGVPYKSHFIISQILILVAFVASLLVLIKVLFLGD